MNCPEARKLLRLYLDSELDAKATQEIELHLESCVECAGLFAAEEQVENRLAEVLRRGRRSASLWDGVEAQIRPARQFAGMRLRWAIAAAVALAIIATISFRVSRPLDLAAAVEHCHNAYVQRLTSPEFTDVVPDEIARQLGDRLDVAAFSFRPSSAAFNSHGGRYCHVGDVPVALILGDIRGQPVSLIVIKRSELEHFPRTKRKLDSGDPIACSRAGRYQFAARLVNGHVVCVVSDTPRPQLEELLRTVNKPG
jgi:anti-sigma factor RsiW